MNRFFIYSDIKKHKAGLTLVELLVVISIIAAVIAISLPAFNAMDKSFDSTGTKGMIAAALSTARTLAISKQRYVGVRFQKEYSEKSILDTDQYMIFIIYKESKEMGNLGDGFCVVSGYKPMKLPENTGVVDLMIRTSTGTSEFDARSESAKEKVLSESDLTDSLERSMTDTSAFSVVFSPAGKLVINDIRIRNKDGEFRPVATTGEDSSDDKVFNSLKNIQDNHTGQFIQDDYADWGLGGEKSRRGLVIYNCAEFKKLTTSQDRYDYLSNSARFIYINPYTGEMINSR